MFTAANLFFIFLHYDKIYNKELNNICLEAGSFPSFRGFVWIFHFLEVYTDTLKHGVVCMQIKYQI